MDKESTKKLASLYEDRIKWLAAEEWCDIHHSVLDEHGVPDQKGMTLNEIDRLGLRAIFLASYYSTTEGMKKETSDGR